MSEIIIELIYTNFKMSPETVCVHIVCNLFHLKIQEFVLQFPQGTTITPQLEMSSVLDLVLLTLMAIP